MATPSPALDDEITALSLQLEDLDYLSHDEKDPVAHSKDFDEARATYRAELEHRLSILQDRKHAQRIARAIIADSPAIAYLLIQDRQARQDRNVALQMSGLTLEIEDTLPDDEDNDQDDDISQALVIFEANYAQEDEEGPSQSRVGLLEWLPIDPSLKTCQTCFDPFPAHKTIEVCEHIYCTDCLKTLFIRATSDQTLYPPRCCRQDFDLALIAPYLSAEELKSFQEAAVEFTTTNRVYCSNKQCGKFVPPSQYQFADRADCTNCGTSTCIHCKGASHTGECLEDPAMRETLALAREEGWQRCNSCSSLVELTIGCYHMTCNCSNQFCYLCGQQWKNCACPQWEERRLLERATEVVDRERAPNNGGLFARRIAVRRAAEQLRENHQCEHTGSFETVENGIGPYTCEICSEDVPIYILRCRQCRVQICRRCRMNRL